MTFHLLLTNIFLKPHFFLLFSLKQRDTTTMTKTKIKTNLCKYNYNINTITIF